MITLQYWLLILKNSNHILIDPFTQLKGFCLNTYLNMDDDEGRTWVRTCSRTRSRWVYWAVLGVPLRPALPPSPTSFVKTPNCALQSSLRQPPSSRRHKNRCPSFQRQGSPPSAATSSERGPTHRWTPSLPFPPAAKARRCLRKCRFRRWVRGRWEPLPAWRWSSGALGLRIILYRLEISQNE